MIITLFTIIGSALAAQVAVSGCGPAGTLPAFGQSTETCVQQINPAQIHESENTMQPQQTDIATQPHPYVGMWVTEDGRIRQALLPNGRYDEARGTRESAYVGRYEITGTSIFYWDDSGFTADGEFVDMNTLHHGGMIMYRAE